MQSSNLHPPSKSPDPAIQSKNFITVRSIEPTPPATRQTSPFRAISSHAKATEQAWQRVNKAIDGEEIKLDGESLEIASVIAVARHGSRPILKKSQCVLDHIKGSVATLKRHLDRGDYVYGVNTGFGGSADTRTQDLIALQRTVLQHQHVGVLTGRDVGRVNSDHLHTPGEFFNHSMPSSWVKATIFVRINSLIRGHSAVSMEVIEAMISLLTHDVTPIIPIRGSISASGDLQPLSYIGGVLEGNPDLYVRTGREYNYRILNAKDALELIGVTPIVLGAKEGLGLVNGTAASAAVAALALYDTNHLALLSQVLTAMGVEALHGTAESFHPFIAAARPHKGQAEAASTILGFLSGSHLAQSVMTEKDMNKPGLCQDRYALRTSSQWIGPQLEDLMLATEQLTVELNSTTDNPLVDIAGDVVHHGGNFQAVSVTSAMEKARLCLQMLGKMLFAQATEMINASLNKGLPANLAADDPSLSFTCKGIDISMAAYMSELAYLANPVSTTVQSAEMHNQAINSLALISARYTIQAGEVLSLLSAAYLFVVCQALDLRVVRAKFCEVGQGYFDTLMIETFPILRSNSGLKERVCPNLWKATMAAWDTTTTFDLSERSKKAAAAALTALMTDPHLPCLLSEESSSASNLLRITDSWRQTLSTVLSQTYDKMRQKLFKNYLETTPTYLGQASTKMYLFVREELAIPFHRGLIEHPTQPLENKATLFYTDCRQTIGSQISRIFEAIRDGRVQVPVMAALKENGCRN